MTTPPPVFLPYTCLATVNGYELYAHNKRPWIVHRYSRRIADDKGHFHSERYVEHLTFEQDWPAGITASEAKRELMLAWADYQSWQESNRPNCSTAGPGNGQ